MKNLILLVLVLFCKTSFGQSNQNPIQGLTIGHSTNYFTTGDSFHNTNLEVGLDSGWTIGAQRTQTTLDSDYGLFLSKELKLKQLNLTPKLGLNQGTILPALQAGLQVNYKIKDSLNLISGINYLKRNDLDDLGLIDVGISKVFDQNTLIARVFNSGSIENPINPSTSIAILNENSKRLVQINVAGGRQTIIGLANYEKSFQNFVGGGVWYRKPISESHSISLTTNYQHNFSPEVDAFGMVYVNGHVNFKF